MNTQALIGVSEKDVQAIRELVEHYRCVVNYPTMLKYLSHVCENITPSHYVVLGYVIGEIAATEQSLQEINNNLSLCQRQN